jgi:DNA-binding NarL/FixJ family response regulator
MVRILIADDFHEWRTQVRRVLQVRPEWEIICEARDGLEAVVKTAELQPDIVLLDIGMPELNGIEASRRIAELSPNTKVVFLSQNSDIDLMAAALATGAKGYVLKVNAGLELVPLIDAAAMHPEICLQRR